MAFFKLGLNMLTTTNKAIIKKQITLLNKFGITDSNKSENKAKTEYIIISSLHYANEQQVIKVNHRLNQNRFSKTISISFIANYLTYVNTFVRSVVKAR